MDNILQNRQNNAQATSTAYSVLVGANQNIFTTINSNNYYCNTLTGTNTLMAYNAGAVSPVPLNTIPAIIGFTLMDTTSISFVVSEFISDTVLDIPLGTTSNLVGRGVYNNAYPFDMFNRGRGLSPTIGAVEFSGICVDSVAPRIYSLANFNCGLGPFPIDIRNFATCNITSDTLYYRVNGGAEQVVLHTTLNGNSRLYNIPSQAPNSTILYRVSENNLNGASTPNPANNYYGTGAQNGNYPPAPGSYDTLTTTISNFPYGYGFDGPNVNKWTVQQIAKSGGWILGSYGSVSNPNFTSAYSGVKVAMFPAAGLANGTASRLVSPCFDLTATSNPTLRFWVSQNADNPNMRDSIVVSVNPNGGGVGSIWIPLTGIVRVDPNFIFPGWKDSQATSDTQFNYTETLTAPFSVDVGGYFVVFDPSTNSTNQVFGKEMPQWLQDVKKKSYRNSKRNSTNK